MDGLRIRNALRACTSVAVLVLCSCFSISATQTPAEPAVDIVRETVANELKPEPALFMFRSRKQFAHGSQTRIYVQSKDATAGMLIAVDDHPIGQSERQAEEGHLDYLLNNPTELRRKQKQEKDDQERATRIVRAMPEAFTFEYAGTEQGRAGLGRPGKALLRLKFRPNPNYDPPTRVEQVLTGMEGILLIDADSHHIAKIDGMLYKTVSFGWGFFGHLDRGGRFQVEQAEVDGGTWQTTRMVLNFTGKILVFKNLVINSETVFTDFRRLPADLSFQQAVGILKKQSDSSANTPDNAAAVSRP